MAEPLPGFVRRRGEVVVGTVAGLRAAKDLPRLVRAVAALPNHVRLPIMGEGRERAAILAEAARTGMRERVDLAADAEMRAARRGEAAVAVADYGEAAMIEACRTLYRSVAGKPILPVCA